MRRFLFGPLFLLLVAASITGQSSTTPLHDGQQVTLTGRLTMEPAGRLQFVTVQTAEAYLPMVRGEDRDEHAVDATKEIGLSGYNRYALLYANRGRIVTVTGTMMTDSASPYYFHNALLKVSSIRLANGTELIGAPLEEISIKPGVKQYRATVLMHADLAVPWLYNPRSAPARDDARSVSCSSNGGGDVVNCFCAKGFHSVGGQFNAGAGRQDAQLFSDGSMAQFSVGDDPRSVQLELTCSR